MEVPVTVSSVESVQQQILDEVSGSDEWEVNIPHPYDATAEDEFSVVNLYKNGANDGQVNVLVEGNGEFISFEYFDSGDTVVHFDTVDNLVSYLNEIIAER
jgi:hypothetical protein